MWNTWNRNPQNVFLFIEVLREKVFFIHNEILFNPEMRAIQRSLLDRVQEHRYPCLLSLLLLLLLLLLLSPRLELEEEVLLFLSIVAEDVSRVMRWQSVSAVYFDRICAVFSFSRSLHLDYCYALGNSARIYRPRHGFSLEWSIDVDENPWSCDALDSMCFHRERSTDYDGYEPEKTMGYNRSHSIGHNLTNLSSQYDDNRAGQSKQTVESMVSDRLQSRILRFSICASFSTCSKSVRQICMNCSVRDSSSYGRHPERSVIERNVSNADRSSPRTVELVMLDGSDEQNVPNHWWTILLESGSPFRSSHRCRTQPNVI